MSSGHVVVLPVLDSRARPRPATRRAAGTRLFVHLASLAALGAYGVMRWDTLLTPGAPWRLLGMLAVSLALALGGAVLIRRSRLLVVGLAVICLIAIFPLSGIPLRWVVHVRIAVSADGIGQGLSALPRVLVPYSGINEWVRVVIMLGAGVLLLDAGLLLAFASPALGDVRRAGAALPLIALAVVPTTLVRPQYSYLQGLLLFALLALFIWGERIRRDEVRLALGVCALAGFAGMIAAPAIDRHKPWINYEALAGTFAPKHVDTFDWSQRYGPLNWPRTGHVVLDVKAARGTYWKAQNLDIFDGRRWVSGIVSDAPPLESVDRSALARWTQTEQVTLRAMRTSSVIAAGTAATPTHISGAVVPGASPGTWAVNGELGPGDSYAVQVYSPAPSPSQLAAAGTQYPEKLSGYLEITLPRFALTTPQGADILSAHDVAFAPFGSGAALAPSPTISDPVAAISGSPYAQAFALVQRLKRTARTPYAYVLSVERFLGRGFAYDETPPQRRYPLESFLFEDRLGYCQQFSGAMALLLRMGGIPARVAAGFTTGTYDSGTHRWLVTDVDAHAWVEAWFPHYGWVPFDPTPAADPARGGHVPIESNGGLSASNPTLQQGFVHRDVTAKSSHAPAGRHRPGSFGALPIIALTMLLAAAGFGLVARGRRRIEPGEDRLVMELERALHRTGRPIGPGVTLAALEQRFREAHDAAAYIRAVRLSRFGAGGDPPTVAQRRALRAELRAGLGLIGRIRALWALPPRLAGEARRASGDAVRGIH